MGKNGTITGMVLLNSSKEELDEGFEAINAGLSNSTLYPIISPYTFKLVEASDAHRHIIDRPSGTIGKVIISPN